MENTAYEMRISDCSSDLCSSDLQMGLTDYDLGGYSLGARTTARMLARGATPRRVILAGMGLRGLVQTLDNGGYYRKVLTNLGTFERGTSEWMTEAFLKTTQEIGRASWRERVCTNV